MPDELLKLVDRFPGRRVLLVGDLMLDRYIFGDATRISPEAPVPVLQVVERQDRVGGAGSVASNLAALGAETLCCGLVGEDPAGELVRQLLSAVGVDTGGVLSVGDRPTITKTRLVGLAEHRHRQQILRVDDELTAAPSKADTQRFLTRVTEMLDRVEAICLEDYAKGLLSPSLCNMLIEAARARGIPVLVDPCRQPDWKKYAGATVLTPNRAELEIGVGSALTDEQLPDAATRLVKQLDLEAVIVTLGRDGALLVQRGGGLKRFPTTPRAVYDNTGAGDAVLAIAAVAVAAGAGFEQVVPLANVAGGLEVSKFGCVPIALDEVRDDLRRGKDTLRGKLRGVTELRGELDARRLRGETVVFTNGCFDILHPGHVELLEKAKALGSMLVVGVNSDASVRALNKGDDRPIRRQEDRVRLLAALETVDYVVLFEQPDPGWLIEQLAPEILVKGADWAGKGVIGQEFVESRGGRVELIELVEGYSTTAELEKIRAGV